MSYSTQDTSEQDLLMMAYSTAYKSKAYEHNSRSCIFFEIRKYEKKIMKEKKERTDRKKTAN
jgi:hypothetical protein